MPLMRSKSKLIYFAHIPKTGGSSVEAYLRQKGELLFHTQNLPNGLPVRPQHFHRKLIEPILGSAVIDHRFAIVRDPLSRMISEYGWLTEGKRKDGPGGRQIRTLWGKPKDLSFDAWVSRVLRAYQSDPFVNDNHIRRQVDFVDPQMKLFRFEDGLDKVFDWIDEISDGCSNARGLHEKRGASVRPPVSDKTRSKIEKFYAKDYTLLDSLT